MGSVFISEVDFRICFLEGDSGLRETSCEMRVVGVGWVNLRLETTSEKDLVGRSGGVPKMKWVVGLDEVKGWGWVEVGD